MSDNVQCQQRLHLVVPAQISVGCDTIGHVVKGVRAEEPLCVPRCGAQLGHVWRVVERSIVKAAGWEARDLWVHAVLRREHGDALAGDLRNAYACTCMHIMHVHVCMRYCVVSMATRWPAT